MAIITIARELGSLGEEVAEELGRLTGYDILDRDHIERRLGEFGFKPEEQQKLDEKRPGFWASLSEHRSAYLHYLKTVLFEEAATGRCIIVGRGGVAVFRGTANHLAVRITAPLELRIARAVDLCSCDQAHARRIVEQSDHDRTGFNKLYFGLDWYDPCSFDLTLNTARLDAERAAKTIDALRSAIIDEAREAAGLRHLAGLLLGQRVLTEIVYTKKVHIQGLEAKTEGGRVELFGLTNSAHALELAGEAAKAVPGVTELKNSIQLTQELSLLP